MSLGDNLSARAGPSAKPPASSTKMAKARKSRSKGHATKKPPTALPTPPHTPKDESSASHNVPDRHEGEAGPGDNREEGSPSKDDEGYYVEFLARLYRFGKAAESGVGVEKSWKEVIKMDSTRISSSLQEAKKKREREDKHKTSLGRFDGDKPSDRGQAAVDGQADSEHLSPGSLRTALLGMVGPDWREQFQAVHSKFRDFGAGILPPNGNIDSERRPASSGCTDPNCDCSIPFVTTFDIEIESPDPGANAPPEPPIAAEATSVASAPKRPDTPRLSSTPVTPITSAEASPQPAQMTPSSFIASPLDAALSELRGKKITTPRLRELWLLAVRNMPRQSETYTFRPAQIVEAFVARVSPRLPSMVYHRRCEVAEMSRLLTSPPGRHLANIVGGNNDDASRHLSLGRAGGPAMEQEGHIADFGRMALLSLETDIDASSGRKRVEFDPVPFYFCGNDLNGSIKGQQSADKTKARSSQTRPLCQELYCLVGLLQVDFGVPMAWSVHFVTRKAMIYPVVPGVAQAALACLKRLVALFSCCDDCEQRPWKVESGKMWKTNEPNADALTAHIVQELIIDPSACIEGLDPRKYTREDQPSPEDALLSEAQMWWLLWRQTQLRLGNFHALKKLSDDLGIVSA